MIIHLKEKINKNEAYKFSEAVQGKLIFNEKNKIIITSSKKNDYPESFKDYINETFNLESDIQLASRDYKKETRSVKINNVEIGGRSDNTLMITGPCSQ